MRTKELLNEQWKFHKGDIIQEESKDKGPLYVEAKTERFKRGPASIYYSDTPNSFETNKCFPNEKWEWVTLPHDFVISGTPDKNENNARGYLKYDNAWYRKKLFIEKHDSCERITLFFEGVSGESEIYLNGCLLYRNFSSYNSFEVDITDFARCGEYNTLAVYVNTERHEGWWYEGGGIYRNVWLIRTDEICLTRDGVFAVTKIINEDLWQLDLKAEVYSIADNDEDVSVTSYVIDADGNTVASANATVSASAYAVSTCEYSTKVHSPKIWDVDAPNLYTVRTEISRSGNITDADQTRIGFRYYECDPDRGLILNGKEIKIKGVCAHDDCGLFGKAVPSNVHKYRMKMLKDMGANGYRTSHYQQNSAILDAADELGFIVLDEARWFSSANECKDQLKELVRRDRNRPSVFFWSISNEEFYDLSEEGRKITKTLKNTILKLDPTRPITAAVDKSPNKATVFDELDIIGINYNLDLYGEVREKYPNKAIFSSENSATGTTRGWYLPDSAERGYLSAFDKDTNAWFVSREKNWQFITERKWVMGGYQWAGFEHRGETDWPRLCSQSGAIDMFLQPKDAFYQNRSHWLTTPTIHILPHWNVESFGDKVRVVVYTNCDEAELFLSKKSLGKKQRVGASHPEWEVDYEAGEIRAVGYISGVPKAEASHTTAGAPKKLMLKLNTAPADRYGAAILTCYTVDENGNFVPTASPTVSFSASNGARIIATGSDICDHTPPCSPVRKMRCGLITVAAGASDFRGKLNDPESITVYAEADGLIGAKLTVDIG